MSKPARKLSPALAQRALGDFREFCGLLSIKTKEIGEVSFGYNRWFDEQKQFHRERTGRDIVLKPRQIGFSTWQLAYDLWFAIVNRGVNVVVMIHDDDMAEEMFLTIQMFADSLRPLGLLPETKYSSKREMVFSETHSAIRIKKAGDTEKAASKAGRSITIHLLHATEVAFWGAAHETMAGVLNSVADKTGQVVIESTANGVGNLFHEDVLAARASKTEYKLHFFPWYQHAQYQAEPPAGFDPVPRDKWEELLLERGINTPQLAWWRAQVADPKRGLEKMLQEFPPSIDAAFRAAGSAYISAGHIDAITPRVCEPMRTEDVTQDGRALGQLLIWEEPETLQSYCQGADVAEGIGADQSTSTVIRHDTGATVATFASNHISPGDFGHALAIIGGFYNGALTAPERNNHGAATLRVLTHEARYSNVYHHDDERPGWPTNIATRTPMFDDLARGIAEGSIYTPHADTLAEARTLIVDKDGKPRARGKSSATGCKDDLYVSWAIAIQVRSRHPIN